MYKPLQSAACLTAITLLLAACSSNDRPYAHESMRHQTAAEQMFGTTGGELSATPPSSAVVMTEPAPAAATVIAPAAPLAVPQPAPQPVPQPAAATIAPSDAAFAEKVAAS